MRALLQLGACAALLALNSCCTVMKDPCFEESCAQSVLRDAFYGGVDALLGQHDFPTDIDRVLVATLVDINDVTNTSMFGRQTAEFVSARMTQHNRDVIHATVRQDHMIVRPDGQFLLSRDIRNLVSDHNARSVVVGTYGAVSGYVFVSLRLVSTVDDSVLSAVEFTLERDEVVDELLSHATAAYY